MKHVPAYAYSPLLGEDVTNPAAASDGGKVGLRIDRAPIGTWLWFAAAPESQR